MAALLCLPCYTMDWSRSEIVFPQIISDGLCKDLNGDGLKDFLILCGNSILIFFQSKDGFISDPDSRIYYKNLGEYIDAADVDSERPGLEILGVSRDGIRCFHLTNNKYYPLSDLLISTPVRLPEFKAGPAFSNFCVDINGDGLDEIFFMKNDILVFYGKNGTGQYQPVPLANLAGLKTASLRCRAWPSGIPSGNTSFTGILMRPRLSDRKFMLIQDMNNDSKWDILGDNLYYQESRFHFSPPSDEETNNYFLTDGKKHRIYLDVDGDKKNEFADIIAKDILSEKINIFPFAKIFIHSEKNIPSQTPDIFFKTIIISGLSPFNDLNSDGKLDFISLWSDLTPGSKEDIIQVLVENIFEYTLRVYLYKERGYTLSPDLVIKTKVEVRKMTDAMETAPLNFFGDYDGNGHKDLLLRKKPGSLLIYLLDWSRKKTILSIDMIQIPEETKYINAIDLNGNGRSELICWTDNSMVIFSPSEEKIN